MQRWMTILFIAFAVPLSAATVSGSIVAHGSVLPLDQVEVTLRYVGEQLGTASQQAQHATLSPDGRFTFSNVKPGIYVLQADGPGIVSTQWESQGPGLAGQALVVQADDVLTGLTMPAVSRRALCGKVFGPDGRPFSNAMVQIERSDSGNLASSWMALGETTSNAGGEYRLGRLLPGYYILHAFIPDSPDHTPSPHPAGVFWTDAPVSDKATPIYLEPLGDIDRCSYDLHMKSIPVAYVGPRYRVEGSLAGDASKVYDPDRAAWRLVPTDRPLWDTEEPEDVPFHASSPSFAFSAVRPGRYRLTLSQIIYIVLSGHCFSHRVDVSEDLTVSGNIQNMRVALRPAAAIQGKVDESHSALDYPWPRPQDRQYTITMTTSDGGCIYGKAAPDGTFTFPDVEPGDYQIKAQLPVGGRYTSGIELNGTSVPGGLVHLSLGDNALRIVERFDSGTFDALIDGKRADGSPARDEHNNWFGAPEHILIFDDRGNPIDQSFGSVQGYVKGAIIAPGRYVAVAGTNAQLASTWRLQDPRWQNQELLRAVVELGVPFEIKAGQTTEVVLPDRTVEIQNLTAKLGIPMFGR